MNLSIFIARRYLFSKKKQNAINIISIISMVGVAIGTTALIVVLSVFNGIDTLLTEATDSFTPDLTISPTKGKFITKDSILIDQLTQMPEVASCDPIVEENSLEIRRQIGSGGREGGRLDLCRTREYTPFHC